MAKSRPERELRARDPENMSDPHAASYKVYQFGRLRGAILPVTDDPLGVRWIALDLAGNITRWRYRDQARDALCEAAKAGAARTG
ncbi:MAG: hypothetical protein HYX53_10800 [Chloroflexi bacterium]|nr:hypothetical protein [Chloroflexota bacterium]